MKTKRFRWISILALIIIILAVVTLSAGAVSKAVLVKQNPAPGQMVDVGGYRLHLHCTGQGSPTVILEAGQGDYSLTWAYVQPEIAKTTRVCSYDRAGFGWSETGPYPRMATAEMKELHTLLANANVQGPYVLVGHSLGGMLMRVYAHLYPDEAAGMVLVDSFHEERLTRNPELASLAEDQAAQFRGLALLNSSGIMAMMPQNIPNPGFPDEAYAQFQAITATTGYFQTFLSEIAALPETSAEVRALQITSFGSLPLTVISAGRWDTIPSISDADNQRIWKDFQTQQSDLAALSSNSIQIIAEQSTHAVQLMQPDLVSNAVREMVEDLRGGGSQGNMMASPAPRSETDFSAIDAYTTQQMERLGIPGMALGILQDGQITHLQGFGTASASGRAVTPQTPFYLGSVTKSFTALAVMQLVEEGKIDLDSPVRTYLPWFKLADEAAAARITVRHLLNQTSGLSKIDGNRFWAHQQDMAEAVRGLDSVNITHPVGTTYEYCNLNYIIAGLVVEAASGQPYEAYVAEHIFAPLDMRHSHASHADALADGLTDGHIIMVGRAIQDDRHLPPAGLPTGFLMVSVEDLAHFALAQLNGGRYGEAAILSPQGIAEMHAPAVSVGNGSYWGIGWDVGELDGTSFIARVGDIGRFHAVLFLLPESGTGVILLANASGYEQMSTQVVEATVIGILNLLTGKPAAPVAVPFLVHFTYWSLLLAPLLQILGAVFAWQFRRRIPAWGAALVVIANLAVVFLILNLTQQSMLVQSMLVFFPDIGLATIAVAVLGIGWSGLYTLALVKSKFLR